MGITTEQYRSCIGCFNSYFITKKSKNSRQVKTVLLRTWSRRISILMAIILCVNFLIVIGGYPTDNRSTLPEEVAYFYKNANMKLIYPTIKPTEDSQTTPWPGPGSVRAPGTIPSSSSSTPHPPQPGTRTRLRGQRSTCSALSGLELNPKAMSSFTAISNFTSRYINGNKKNQGIKIAHWNKGNAFFKLKWWKLKA